MDSEEIRRKRREKILQRNGIAESNVAVKEEITEEKQEEISVREQMDMIEGIETYKVSDKQKKVKSVKIGVIVIMAVIGGYYASIKNKYLVLACFLSALIPYKFITEITYGIITPDVPLNVLEKTARKVKMFKEFFADIFLFLCALTLAMAAWGNIFS